MVVQYKINPHHWQYEYSSFFSQKRVFFCHEDNINWDCSPIKTGHEHDWYKHFKKKTGQVVIVSGAEEPNCSITATWPSFDANHDISTTDSEIERW